MNKFLATLSLIFLTSTAFAATATTPTTPEVNPPAAAVVCATGPSWKEGGEKFLEDATAHGASHISTIRSEDGSFVVLIDVRGTPEYNGEPDFILAMQFDPAGCYVMSIMITEQVMQDALGITLANE